MTAPEIELFTRMVVALESIRTCLVILAATLMTVFLYFALHYPRPGK